MKRKVLSSHSIPADFLDVVVEFNLTKAEIMVFLYLMKHLIKSSGDSIHLTYDELQSGSKFSEGVRGDKGTGLSVTSIKTAVMSLESKELLEVERNGTGTERKYRYSLRYPHPTSRRCFSMFCQNLSLEANKFLALEANKFLALGTDFCLFFIGDLSPKVDKSLSVFSSSRKEEEKKEETKPLRQEDDNTPPLLRSSAQTIKQADQYQLAAKQLWFALADKGLLGAKSNISKWAAPFRKYAASTGFNWESFQEVLNWYCDHIGEKYIPHAFSATSFCEKFPAIKIAKDRLTELEEDALVSTAYTPTIENEPSPETADQLLRDSTAHLL